MFCQPELLDEEIALFIRVATQECSSDDANNLALRYDKLHEAYKAGDIPLDDPTFQRLLYSIRCRSCKYGTGPSGYEGWLWAAVVQDTLDWGSLSTREREGFSEFLESERKRYQERAAVDPKGALEASKTIESRKTDDDYLGYRAKKIIKSPEYLALFWSKISSGFKADALAKSPANGCERCGSKSDVAKLKRCTRCKRAFYCNEHCQLADWKAKHKVQCKFLASLAPPE